MDTFVDSLESGLINANPIRDVQLRSVWNYTSLLEVYKLLCVIDVDQYIIQLDGFVYKLYFIEETAHM